MIKLYKVYYVKNEDLGLTNETFGHEVITISGQAIAKESKLKLLPR